MPQAEVETTQNGTIAQIPTPTDLKQQSSTSNWAKDRNALGLLFCLWLVQGLSTGFLFVTVPVTLMSKGATYKDLLIITFSYIPLCFKSCVAPWMNKHYIKAFGKGKTYYVPAQIITGVTLLFLSRYGERLMDLESIPMLSVAAVFVIVVLIFTEISLEGWLVDLISAENGSYGPTCQAVGWNVGFFLAYNVFMPFNSVEFCNNTIYSTPQSEPLFQTKPFLTVIAVLIFVFAAVVQFFLKEEEKKVVQEEKGQEAQLGSILETLKVFTQNPNFRKLLFIYLTWNLIFGPIHNLVPNMAFSKGITKELFTNVNAPITPANVMFMIYLGKLCSKYSETKMAKVFWIVRLLSTFFIFATIMMLDRMSQSLQVITLLTSILISTISFNAVQLALGAFAARISRETYGAPLMSTFGAIANVNRLISDVFLFVFLDLFGWESTAIASLVGMMLYAVVLTKELKCFENKNLKEMLMGKAKQD